MKKSVLLIIGGLLLIMSQCAFAQTTEKKYTIPEGMLTEQQKQLLESSEQAVVISSQLEQVSKFAGMGEEIGDAMDGALGAVKDNSIEIAESDLGKFVMMLVGWKVLWIHVLRMGIAIFMFLIATVILTFSYFKTLNNSMKPDYQANFYGVSMASAAALHWIFFILTMIACGIIGFA